MAKRKPKPSDKNELIATRKELAEAIERRDIALKDVEGLENKIVAYMHTAADYKSLNEDLKVRCEEVEEMLRQAEAKLEIANKMWHEAENEVVTQREMKEMFFNSLNKAIKEKEELEEMLNDTSSRIGKANKRIEELEESETYSHDNLEVQCMVSQKWREKFEEEKAKTWWQKFKEGLKK